MGSMAVNFVGGIPFQLLYDGVKLLLRSTRIFRTQLINLEFTLDTLQPRILQEIGDNSVQVNLPNNIIQELQTKISDGTELVKKLSRLSIWNIRIWGNCWNFIKPNYAEQLDQLDRCLRALIEQLDMEQRRNVTLLLCSVRNLQDKNDEWEDKFSKFLRGQEELKVLLLGNTDAIGRIEANSVQQVASSSREEAVPSPAKNLGLVFSMLFNVVARVQVKNKMIKRVLKELKSTLNCLQPLIEEMAEYDKILQLPKQEVEDLRILISNCVEYAQNCSNVGEHANYKKYRYTNKILNSNQSLQRLYINLKGQVEMKVKEAMDSARKTELAIKKIEGDGVVPNDELRSERQSRVSQPGLNLLTMQGPLDVIKETSDTSENITEEPIHMVETSVNLEGFREEGVKPIERSGQFTVGAEQQKTEIEWLVEVKTSPKLRLDGVDVEKTSEMRSKITITPERKRFGLMGLLRYGSSSAAHTNPYTNTASTPATSETQSRNRVSQTSSSSTGRSQFSQISEATTSTLSPNFDDYGDDLKSTDGQILDTSSLRVFTFADMKSATKNFKSDQILGEGGFGRVFKGWVDEKTLQPCKAGTGMMVAVKKLNPESMQGYQEWQSEVNFLGRLSHPNLVKLLGYCVEDMELLLVYEFMLKGSLENHLFKRHPNIEPLSWDNRIKIAIGAARGLAFLHSSEKQIIYRDFKASNILLDGSYNAKISDFGLAKLWPTGGDSYVSTRIMGTYGYAAPEYIATGNLYVKSDVYGFGVVLLEILTGLRALDTKRPKEQVNLIEWAKPLLPHKRKLKTILDARIEGQYNLKAAIQTANVALKCLAPEPRSRPSMKEVLEELEQVQAIRLNTKNSILTSRQSIPAPRSYVLQEPVRRPPLNSRYHASG